MPTGTRRLRELTIRYAVKKDGDGQPTVTNRIITTPASCAAVFTSLLQDESCEVFGVLCLTTKHHVIAYHEVSRGSLDMTLVHPRLCWAEHKRGYVAEIVMWPWPWRAADHRARHVIGAT